MSPTPLDLPERVAVLETQVSELRALPKQITALVQNQAELRSDMKHVMEGGGRLTSAVDELRGVMGARAATEAAAAATVMLKLDHLNERFAARSWPPAAKATMIVGAMAFVGTIITQVL